jgi:hypothetical protein
MVFSFVGVPSLTKTLSHIANLLSRGFCGLFGVFRVSQKGCWTSRKLLVLLRFRRGKVKKGWKRGKRGREKRVDKGVKKGLNSFPLSPTFLHFIILPSHHSPFVPLLSTAA